jgi:hypothetical protein
LRGNGLLDYHTRTMKLPKDRLKLFRNPPKTLLEDWDPELDAPIRGPLFSRPVLYVLLAVFGLFVMLTVDWFGLLLLNSEGVILTIGPLNTLRVTAVLMTGIAAPSVLLMAHYRRVYSYISEENVFFAITFAISFVLGAPCALVGLFG